MRLLYFKNFKKCYLKIASEINNLKVLDVCCGDCYLSNFVEKSRYRGYDINKAFVEYAQQKKLDVDLKDIEKDEIDSSECIAFKDSLYQFIPNHEKIIKKLLQASEKKLIIVENIQNLSTSNNKIISFLAKYLANPGTGHKKQRFDGQEIVQLFKKYNATSIVPLGRDVMAVFEK